MVIKVGNNKKINLNVRRFAVICTFFFAAGCLTVFALSGHGRDAGGSKPVPEPQMVQAGADMSEKLEQEKKNSSSEKDLQKEDAPPQELQKVQESSTGGGDDETAGVPDTAVGNSYFADAVFIGDSRTEGFQLHAGLTEASYLTAKGLNVKDVFNKPLVKGSSGTITIAQALQEKTYNKYYIMLGANELGWVYTDVFTEKYGQIIDLIRQVNPQAVIYVQSILPVTQAKSESDAVYNNTNISRFNELLKTLAQEKNVNYLNVGEAVAAEGGALCDEAATDGVHLNKPYCEKWLEYLKSHTVQQ